MLTVGLAVIFLFFLISQYLSHRYSYKWLVRQNVLLQERNQNLEAEKEVFRVTLEKERIERRGIEYERDEAKKSAAKIEELIVSTQKQIQERFEIMSHDAFFKSQNAFFKIAKETFDQYNMTFKTSMETKTKEVSTVVEPLQVALAKMEKKVEELELVRRGAYEGVFQQISQLTLTHALLQKETAGLTKALREPTVRGRWGEVQLRRVVEVAGMLPFCDFEEQVHVGSAEGAIRPDMVVKLPNERVVVIDAKVSLAAYLDAMQSEDLEEKKLKLVEHSRMVRQHVIKLSQKKYWDQFPKAPDFVVLFLHGDCFLVPALEHDTELLEFASSQKVLLATPTSLIAMLKVVAYGWQEAKIEQHAKVIVKEAKQWLERSKVFSGHLDDLGRSLERSLKAHERVTASFEHRLLPSVRRLVSSNTEEELFLEEEKVLEEDKNMSLKDDSAE
jgi:DNA recombination protein RmuC